MMSYDHMLCYVLFVAMGHVGSNQSQRFLELFHHVFLMSTNSLDAGLGMLRLATGTSDGEVEQMIQEPSFMYIYIYMSLIQLIQLAKLVSGS